MPKSGHAWLRWLVLTEQADKGLVRGRWAVARRLRLTLI